MTYKYSKGTPTLFRVHDDDRIELLHYGRWYSYSANIPRSRTLDIKNIPKIIKSHYSTCSIFKSVLKELFYKEVLRD